MKMTNQTNSKLKNLDELLIVVGCSFQLVEISDEDAAAQLVRVSKIRNPQGRTRYAFRLLQKRVAEIA